MNTQITWLQDVIEKSVRVHMYELDRHGRLNLDKLHKIIGIEQNVFINCRISDLTAPARYAPGVKYETVDRHGKITTRYASITQ